MPKYGQGRKEPARLQGIEFEEVKTDESNGESDEVQPDHQRSAGGEKDCDDKGSIFSLIFDHAPSRAAAPVRRAAHMMTLTPTADGLSNIGGSTKTSSEPIGIGSPRRVNNPSIGSGKSDVSTRPVPTSPGSDADGATSSLVLNGRKACRLECTAVGLSGTVKGRTHEDVRRLVVVVFS